MDVTNKVAIVTGGLGGIGFATVQTLLKCKIDFVAIFDLYKTEDEVVHQKLEVLQKIYKNNRYGYYACDVKNVSEFTACYKRVLAHKSYVDILINNAGVVDRNIDLTIDVNFKAVVHGTMIAIEHMGKHNNNKGGVVVNIASNLGLKNISTLPVYCATKHAVISFVRCMKDHNETLGVRIVCICPGLTNTNMPTSDNLCDGVFEFVSEDEIDQIQYFYFQSSDNVASAIIEIIKRGREGDVWMVHNDEPPIDIAEEIDLDKLGISCVKPPFKLF